MRLLSVVPIRNLLLTLNRMQSSLLVHRLFVIRSGDFVYISSKISNKQKILANTEKKSE